MLNLEYLAAVALNLDGEGLIWLPRHVPNEEMRKDHARLVAVRDGADSGAELSVWLGCPTGSREERFVISPTWPRTARDYYRPSRDAQSSITVASRSSPARLASEIKRRLLPLYFEQLDQALAAIKRDREAWQRRDALARSVGESWGCAVRSYPNRNPETDEEQRVHLPHSEHFDADVVVRPYCGAKFTVTLKDPAQVRLLADFVNGLRAREVAS